MRLLTLWLLVGGCGFAAGCVTSGDELQGLAETPPLDCAVLVTGGAFLAASSPADTTFGDPEAADPTGAAREVIPIGAFADVFERGRVFQRVAIDPDAANRARLAGALPVPANDVAFTTFLERARADGFDFLLVVEQLQDGPIEMQGTNGRWPVTFATWILLGVGAFIPDRTFESRATLRVTLRELQMGRELHDSFNVAGPVDLTLIERTDVLGLLTSIVVPPFWVPDDPAAVRASVRLTAERRLLSRLARDLKSESVRQRLRDRVPAELTMLPTPTGWKVVVRAAEAITVARLRDPGLDPAAAAAFAQALLASLQIEAGRYRYEAALPAAVDGRAVQVLVGTLRGGVASATFRPGETR